MRPNSKPKWPDTTHEGRAVSFIQVPGHWEAKLRADQRQAERMLMLAISTGNQSQYLGRSTASIMYSAHFRVSSFAITRHCNFPVEHGVRYTRAHG